MRNQQSLNNINVLSEKDKEEIIKTVKRLKEDATAADFLKDIHLKFVWKTTVPQYFFYLTAFLAFVSFIYFVTPDKYICLKNICITKDKIPLIDFLLYAFWAIAPPIFFLFEYLYRFPYKLDQGQFNDLKYTHELATKIWAALLIIFGIILFSKYGVR